MVRTQPRTHRLDPSTRDLFNAVWIIKAWHALEALALKGLVTAEVEVLLLVSDVVSCQKVEARRVGSTGKMAKLAAEPFN